MKALLGVALALALIAPALCLAIGFGESRGWIVAVGFAGLVGAMIIAAVLARSEETPRQPPVEAPDQRSLAALAAGLAHELGQPLSAARVGIEGLHYLRQLGREPSPEHTARTLGQVGMSLIAMTQTIEHLRALAAADAAPALTEVNLADAVEAVLGERDQWLRYRDVAIAWERPAQPVVARADPAGLRLILVNLLRNAVEAVSGQGEGRRHVRVTVSPDAAIAVHDSGAGIAEADLPRLFDPFFSTKAGAVRGIGLSLAQASAQRMDARLEVASALGGGSTFTVRLRQPGERR
jgi:two-component system C4-dicarboxylate transport sensor histidine kinase DctB